MINIERGVIPRKREATDITVVVTPRAKERLVSVAQSVSRIQGELGGATIDASYTDYATGINLAKLTSPPWAETLPHRTTYNSFPNWQPIVYTDPVVNYYSGTPSGNFPPPTDDPRYISNISVPFTRVTDGTTGAINYYGSSFVPSRATKLKDVRWHHSGTTIDSDGATVVEGTYTPVSAQYYHNENYEPVGYSIDSRVLVWTFEIEVYTPIYDQQGSIIDYTMTVETRRTIGGSSDYTVLVPFKRYADEQKYEVTETEVST